jgi:predicted lipoprotein with Yx(FWY)xxD motif
VSGVRRSSLITLVLAALAVLGVSSGRASSAADKPTVTVGGSDYGRIVFDGSSRALYAFTRDRGGRSACYGACAAAWPPYIVKGALRAGGGTSRPLLGTTARKDGRRQLTYAGRPVYYYVGDGPGQVLCQNVREYGGLWLVVRPSGRLVR